MKAPRAGRWIAFDSAFIGGSVATVVRKGHIYAFDDPAVQHSPNLFRAADLSPDEDSRAEADYLTATLE